MGQYADKNELYHWLKGAEAANHKYISRFFKNGKWQYIYDTVKGSNSQKDTRPFKERFKDWMGYSKGSDLNKKAFRLGTNVESTKKKRKETGELSRETKARTKAYQKAKEEYYKTPIGKINKFGESVSKKLKSFISSKKLSSIFKSKTTQKENKEIKKTNKSSISKKISELTGSKEKGLKQTKAALKLVNDYNTTKKQRKQTGELNRDSKAKARSYQRARDSYNKTAIGRIESFINKKKKKK